MKSKVNDISGMPPGNSNAFGTNIQLDYKMVVKVRVRITSKNTFSEDIMFCRNTSSNHYSVSVKTARPKTARL